MLFRNEPLGHAKFPSNLGRVQLLFLQVFFWHFLLLLGLPLNIYWYILCLIGLCFSSSPPLFFLFCSSDWIFSLDLFLSLLTLHWASLNTLLSDIFTLVMMISNSSISLVTYLFNSLSLLMSHCRCTFLYRCILLSQYLNIFTIIAVRPLLFQPLGPLREFPLTAFPTSGGSHVPVSLPVLKCSLKTWYFGQYIIATLGYDLPLPPSPPCLLLLVLIFICLVSCLG